ncbi:MAG: PqiC family protein [Cypionkella sp.]
MIHFRFALLVSFALISACSNAAKTEHYLIDTPVIARHLPNRLGRVAVRDVSLPQYASGQEIPFQTTDGALHSRSDQVWADDPVRAITGVLAAQISQISGATAIAEPWPFSDAPNRRLEVRIERMLAGVDGNFQLNGQYFVTSEQGGGDVAKRFKIAVPISGEGPAATAAAQALALQKLAEKIASLSS